MRVGFWLKLRKPEEVFVDKGIGIRSPLALSLANSVLEFDGSGVTGD
jgi:hypothetical protein